MLHIKKYTIFFTYILYIVYGKVIYKSFAYIVNSGDKRGRKMIETMPGCEPIILERAQTLLYCGGCMTEMRCVHGSLFECPICGMSYRREMST